MHTDNFLKVHVILFNTVSEIDISKWLEAYKGLEKHIPLACNFTALSF